VNCRCFARYMAKYNGQIILGSDAHFWDRVGEFSDALDVIHEVGISEHQIMNTSPERVLDYLATRRMQRLRVAKVPLSIA
jgi:putative hydrolase